MGRANAAAFPATQELLKARASRQTFITAVFVALVVLTLAGSKLADVTGFESTRPTTPGPTRTVISFVAFFPPSPPSFFL